MNYRHGDVALKRIKKLPKGIKELKDKTLAYGEFTGHSHRFADPKNIKRYVDGDRTYLEVLVATPLIHEEHNKIIIEPGMYEQIQEREYDPFLESIRTVID
jgi:hypothetical protein